MRVNPWLLWTLLLSLLILGLQSIPTNQAGRAPDQATAPTIGTGNMPIVAGPAATAPATPAHDPGLANVTTPVDLKVYRWQDADGEWHVSNEPPPEGSSFQVREYSH